MSFKLLIAIFASLLIHAILIFKLTTFNNANVFTRNSKGALTTTNLSVPILQVGFVVLSKSNELTTPNDITIEDKQALMSLSKSSDNTLTHIENAQIANQALNRGLSQAQNDQSFSISKVTQPHYFKSSEVDISAIPLHGVRPPILITINKLLEIYKIRVFINKNGIVDQVVNLNESNSVQINYSNIEEQIKELTFIPAKKEGVEVDSYIDIALEF